MKGLGSAPTVEVSVRGSNGDATLNVLPDSGADITAAEVHILAQLGEHVGNILPSTHKTAYSVDGSTLQSLGQMTIQITLGEITVTDTFQVFPSIPGGMLISWKTAKNLNILPKDYPAQIRVTTTVKELTAEDFISKFPSVFNGQVRVMTGETFRIHLKDNAKPFCVSAPRMIPYSYRGKVQKELHSLQVQGIIEPVTEPTEWCAPIVVTPKKNSEDIRICVDFSKLNKYVPRELYSVCTPSDAIADISSIHSKYFTVFDALKGYHQCPLEATTQLLTTFMTPFGRFKFLRAPFGICSISEHYNRRMDEAFQGLTNYRRIVDDVIIFDEDKRTHATHVRQFLQRCAPIKEFLYIKKNLSFVKLQ